jgi:hypothetical protein
LSNIAAPVAPRKILLAPASAKSRRTHPAMHGCAVSKWWLKALPAPGHSLRTRIFQVAGPMLSPDGPK